MKIKFDYKFVIITIIFIVIILGFGGCSMQPINVYASETTTTEDKLLETYPDRVITYNCTLYTLSDGTQIPLPNVFTSKYKNFIIYKTTLGSTYYVIVPNFKNYTYSTSAIIPTKTDGTTFTNTRNYILDLGDDYVNYPTFELYFTTLNEGENEIKFRFCNSSRNYYYSFDSSKLYGCSNLVVTDDDGFFYQSRFLASEMWKATKILGKDFGIALEMVSVLSSIVLPLLLVIGFKMGWIFFKKNLTN